MALVRYQARALPPNTEFLSLLTNQHTVRFVLFCVGIVQIPTRTRRGRSCCAQRCS